MGSYYAGMMNSSTGRELRHWGIKGMHWYQRRFQNEDGSLTPAGRERYGVGSGRSGKETPKSGMSMNTINKLAKKQQANTQKGSKFDGSPKAGMSTNPQDYGSAEFEKNYKKYQRLQGTKSLLGGDHSKDESVKVLTDYQNEIYKNRNRLRNKEKSDYKNSVADIASKYTDKYAKAVLKDMGYDTSPESIAWLRQQPWFYLGGASEIVF